MWSLLTLIHAWVTVKVAIEEIKTKNKIKCIEKKMVRGQKKNNN